MGWGVRTGPNDGPSAQPPRCAPEGGYHIPARPMAKDVILDMLHISAPDHAKQEMAFVCGCAHLTTVTHARRLLPMACVTQIMAEGCARGRPCWRACIPVNTSLSMLAVS